MAATSSTNIPLGTLAPGFTLLNVTRGVTESLDELRSADGATVVLFICNHCPYVVHIAEGLADIAREYQQRGAAFIAVCSNDAVAYPQDAPERMAEFAARHGFTFPYLYDETQEVARAYDAVCTPDIYVFDNALRLAYHGQFDASRPGNEEPVTGADVRAVLDALLAGRAVDTTQTSSIGCSIKWKTAG